MKGRSGVFLDGIRFRMFSVGCILGLLGLFLAIVSIRHDKKYRLASVLSLTCCVLYVAFYSYVLANPLVLSCEGELKETYRDSRKRVTPLTYAYVFDIGEQTNPVFYLDAFTRKKHFPEEPEVGKRYTVYYEKRTKIIVNIEQESTDEPISI